MAVGAFLFLVAVITVLIIVGAFAYPALSARLSSSNKAMKAELKERRKIMSEIRKEAIRYQQIEGQLPNVILDILNNYEIKELD